MAAPPKQLYSDRYEPLRLVARGGMAEVWLAHDALLDRTVALKILFPELSVDRNFVERFRREAQAAANLSHPNIVAVYDWGEEDPTYFIVMEYVEGEPLSAVLREEGPFAADRAAAIGVEVAAALGYAHRSGVIHRDVKPGNVLITTDDRVKVTDFGIARAANTQDHLTQTGAVMGTAAYFSPEQAQGLPVDQRSDVYALGVVLYEMVAGEPPFVADGPVAVAYKHVHEQPTPPTAVIGDLPVAYEAIVLQALAKDLNARYASAEELRADLVRFRQGRPVLADPPGLGGGVGVVAGAGSASPPGGRAAARRARGRSDEAAVAAVAAVGTRTIPKVPSAPAGATRPPGGLAAALRSGDSTSHLGSTPDLGSTLALSATELPASELATAERWGPTWMYGVILAVLLSALGVVLFLIGRQLGVVDTTAASGTRIAKVAVTVPANLIGQSYTDAANEVGKLGVQVTEVDSSDTTHPVNTVISTNPSPGQQVPPGGVLQLTVSSGPPPITEPDVLGEQASAATQQLQQAGFDVGPQQSRSSGTVSAGDVLSTSPPPGFEGQAGQTVTLVVSSGPAKIPVPNETGKDQATATNDLTAAGFQVLLGQRVSSASVPAGSVVQTDPAAGTPLLQGSTVYVDLSSGPAMVRVPYVLNYTEANARADIQARGLVVSESTDPVSNPDQNGVVIDQEPGAGVPVPQGSTVDIVIGQYGG